jgi:gluconate 2-dehydrogenase gamma chain
MDRRSVLVSLATMFGASLVAPIREAIANGLDAVNMTGASLPGEAQRLDTEALAETIIPETDTPGARAASVGEFIEFMLQEWYPAEDRDRFVADLAGLGEYCDTQFGRRFSALRTEQQIEVVTTLMNGKAANFKDGGAAFFEHAKQLTVFGYYTSEIGMTVERRYLPMPGRYDGDYPYEKVGTLFTA